MATASTWPKVLETERCHSQGCPRPGAEGSVGALSLQLGGLQTSPHFTFTFRKTKENGSGVNPCCVLN